MVLDYFDRKQKIALAGLIDLVFWISLSGFVFFFGLQIVGLGGILIFAAVFLHLLIGGALYSIRDTGSFVGYTGAPKQQLSEQDVKELTEWALINVEGYYPAQSNGGVEPAVTASDDKEDAKRLFIYEFKPLNMSGRATVLIDLEQEISVDIGDDDSMEKAWRKIRDKNLKKSWLNTDYEGVVEKTKKSMGRSKSPVIRTVREGENGRVVEERPVRALPSRQNQGNSQEESESSS